MNNYKYKYLFEKDGVEKKLHIYTDDNSVDISNREIYNQQFEFEDGICSDNNLMFGLCESSSVKFKISNIGFTLKDKWINIDFILDGHSEEPFHLGKFKVNSDKQSSDKKSRDVTGYDSMHDILYTDITDWYNGIVFPIKLKILRDLFFEHIGITQQEISLPNDDIIVSKTEYYSSLSGGDLIQDICEINGCFGRIGENGEFKYIFLSQEEHEIKSYKDASYGEYFTHSIDSIIISQESSESDYRYGNGENPYVVKTRVLQYKEYVIEDVCRNLLSVIRNISYVPAEISAIGNPCIECGDRILVRTKYGDINTYVLKRTLSGIQSLNDMYTADGEEFYDFDNSDKSVTRIVDGKISKITNDMFYSYVFENSEDVDVGMYENTIIRYNVVATSDTHAIVFATITFESDNDGYVVINYSQDLLEIEKKQQKQYITKGNNTITVCNWFNVSKDKRAVISISIYTERCESQLRIHEAKINSLINFAETGILEEPVIENSAPILSFKKGQISSVLLAKGIDRGGEFSGIIELTEFMPKSITLNKLFVKNFADGTVEASTQIPIGNLITQEFIKPSINKLSVFGFNENVTCNYVYENQNVEFAGTEYTYVSEGITKLKNVYVIEPISETIDSGYMSSVEIVTDVFQSVESVVIE